MNEMVIQKLDEHTSQISTLTTRMNGFEKHLDKRFDKLESDICNGNVEVDKLSVWKTKQVAVQKFLMGFIVIASGYVAFFTGK